MNIFTEIFLCILTGYISVILYRTFSATYLTVKNTELKDLLEEKEKELVALREEIEKMRIERSWRLEECSLSSGKALEYRVALDECKKEIAIYKEKINAFVTKLYESDSRLATYMLNNNLTAPEEQQNDSPCTNTDK